MFKIEYQVFKKSAFNLKHHLLNFKHHSLTKTHVYMWDDFYETPIFYNLTFVTHNTLPGYFHFPFYTKKKRLSEKIIISKQCDLEFTCSDVGYI